MKLTGGLGLASALMGLALLLFTFYEGYQVFLSYGSYTATSNLASSMSTLLYAAVQALFLGIMGWVGSLLMLRGIEFSRVEGASTP